MASKEYFAAQDAETVIERCSREVNAWGMNTFSSGVFSSVVSTYWRNNLAYYSAMIVPDSNNSALGFAGEQGELVKVTLPVAKTLTKQFVTLVTKQRLNFEVLTDNTDAAPFQTARIGKSICSDVRKKCELDKKLEHLAERTAVLSASYVSNTWRSDKGYIYSQSPDGQALYSGDNYVETHDMFDVVYDWSVENFTDLTWLILKRRMNRYDLIAQYPDMADAIAGVLSAKQTRQSMFNNNNLGEYENEDVIIVNEFYHKPTPALPQGRMVAYCNNETVFYDDINPYDEIPVYELSFEKINKVGLSYAMFTNLLPAQEMLDHSASVQATNQSAFGVQSLLSPRGSDMNVEQLSTGMNLIHYSPLTAEGGGEPKPLELPKTPPEVGTFMNDMNSYLGNLSMINDTLRGQPPSNVSSGAMAATLSANAMEFLSSAQKSVVLLVENIMNRSIKNYKQFSSMPQLIDIVGIGNIAYAKEFKESDLKSLSKVEVKTMSPMLNSSSGRIQIADSLLSSGLLKSPEAYFQILEGQDISVLYKDSLSEQMAIQAENDALLEGNPVTPLIFDNHPQFIKSYQGLLYNPYVRANGQIVQAVVGLMQERMNMEMSIMSNPMLAQIVSSLRGTPVQMPQPGGMETGTGMPLQPEQKSEAPGGGKTSKPAKPAETDMTQEIQQPIGM